jgi:hypothetical protein
LTLALASFSVICAPPSPSNDLDWFTSRQGREPFNALTGKFNPRKIDSHEAFNEGHGLCVQLFMQLTTQIPSLTSYDYRGYVIGAWARPELTKGSTPIGVVYNRDKFGSMIQVQRIEGKLFANKEEAERHGLKLCKNWIDRQSKYSGDDERLT